MQFNMAVYCVLLLILSVRPVNTVSAVHAANESVGGRLLEDLPADSNHPAPTQQQSNNPAHVKALENALKASSPIASFGIGGSPAKEPLARIQEQMQYAQSLLPQSGADGKATKVQEQVISDLDKLIAELSKQCQGSQCQNPSQPKPGENQKPDSGKPSAMASGRSAARDSAD